LNCEECPIKEECEELKLKAEKFCPILYVVKRYLKREIEEAETFYRIQKLAEKLKKPLKNGL